MACGQCGTVIVAAEASMVSTAEKKALPVVPKGAGGRRSGGAVQRDLLSVKNEEADGTGSKTLIERKPVKVFEKEAESREGGNEQVEDLPDGGRRIRRRKKRARKDRHKVLLLILLGWLVVIGAVTAVFMKDAPEVAEEDEGEGSAVSEVRDRAFVKLHGEKAMSRFRDFMGAGAVNSREQYVDRPSEMALPMSRYYRTHPFPLVAGKVIPIATNVIEIRPSPDLLLGLETIWRDAEGSTMGALQFNRGEGWVLDWEQFAPYSTGLWSAFVADLGQKEGVFRLLARKRRDIEEASREVGINFYRAPLFGEKEDAFLQSQSPRVSVSRRSPLGKEFISRWESFEAGEDIGLPGSFLPSLDPKGYLRITVRLGWEDAEDSDDRIMVLREILGQSWHGRTVNEILDERAVISPAEEGEEPEVEVVREIDFNSSEGQIFNDSQ